MIYKKYIKRLLDIVLSTIALIILSPILLITFFCLLISNKGKSVFFIHERPGKDGIIFKVVKFKTMTDDCDKLGNLLPDSHRITKIGKFVRQSSIDELPQLINVFKGEMSLIGPRPLSVLYLPLYNETHARRHDVRPGISGWAQVNGRNLIPFSKRFIFDVWYIDHLTFSLDVKICIMTVLNVLQKKNIGNGSDDMQIIDDLHFEERIQELNKQKNA